MPEGHGFIGAPVTCKIHTVFSLSGLIQSWYNLYLPSRWGGSWTDQIFVNSFRQRLDSANPISISSTGVDTIASVDTTIVSLIVSAAMLPQKTASDLRLFSSTGFCQLCHLRQREREVEDTLYTKTVAASTSTEGFPGGVPLAQPQC